MSGVEFLIFGLFLGIVITLIGFLCSLAGRVHDLEAASDADVKIYEPQPEVYHIPDPDEVRSVLYTMRTSATAKERQVIDYLIYKEGRECDDGK